MTTRSITLSYALSVRVRVSDELVILYVNCGSIYPMDGEE